MRQTIEYWLVRSLFSLPVPAGFYARLLDLAVPRLRKVAVRNLELAGLPEPLAITAGVFDSLGRVLATFAQFPGISSENVHRWIRYDGVGNFLRAREQGRGVLVATAHLGNWELSAFAHALMTAPMHVVVRPLDNPQIDEMVEQQRALSGNHIIRKKQTREVLRALAQGEAVGILIDQNTLAAEGVFIDFFGVKACAHPGIARIAHHTGSPVVPGFALWNEKEQRYVLRFYPPIEITGDAQADTQRIHSHLESVIREYPDQWLWIHRRWKTRPPGDPPLY